MERTDGPGPCLARVQFGGGGERAGVGLEHGVESWTIAVERADAVEVDAHGLDGRTVAGPNRLRERNGAE